MRLLVLGGTSFVGRAVAAEALRRRHDVATFNRGRSGRDLPGVEAIRGDRSRPDGLDGLARRSFDAAVDTSGLVPGHVLRTARALAGSTPFYAYVSSISAYRDWERWPAHEQSAIHDAAPDEEGDPADFARYGPRKAGCERAVRESYGDDDRLVVRPGTIVGPDDNVGHLPWWLRRTAAGGPVVAPGHPGRTLQLLDVRDLAAFVLDRVEARLGGTFNTVPNEPATTGDWLRACVAATGDRAELVWVDQAFLLAAGIQPWDELPLWMLEMPGHEAACAVPGVKAAAAGLLCRPPDETVRDTWEWLAAGGVVRLMPGLPVVGLDPVTERRILAYWREARASSDREAWKP